MELLRTNVEAVRVVLLDLFPLRSGVRPRERDVFISRVEALSQVHLGTLGGSKGQLRDTTVLPVDMVSYVQVRLLYYGSYRSWAIMRPVGPAPMRRACEPALGAIFSRPCMAQEAGSIRAASMSLMFWILKRRPWVKAHCNQAVRSGLQDRHPTTRLTYSAKPPSRFRTPWAEKSSQ
jgi:hypothetical protein